jgi:hypothetical protein
MKTEPGLMLVSMRVGTQAYAVSGSSVAACADCGNKCWISPGSRKRMQAVESAGVICFECFQARDARGDVPRSSTLEAADIEEFKREVQGGLKGHNHN